MGGGCGQASAPRARAVKALPAALLQGAPGCEGCPRLGRGECVCTHGHKAQAVPSPTALQSQGLTRSTSHPHIIQPQAQGNTHTYTRIHRQTPLSDTCSHMMSWGHNSTHTSMYLDLHKWHHIHAHVGTSTAHTRTLHSPDSFPSPLPRHPEAAPWRLCGP